MKKTDEKEQTLYNIKRLYAMKEELEKIYEELCDEIVSNNSRTDKERTILKTKYDLVHHILYDLGSYMED